jgi:hypothetical protein
MKESVADMRNLTYSLNYVSLHYNFHPTKKQGLFLPLFPFWLNKTNFNIPISTQRHRFPNPLEFLNLNASQSLQLWPVRA